MYSTEDAKGSIESVEELQQVAVVDVFDIPKVDLGELETRGCVRRTLTGDWRTRARRDAPIGLRGDVLQTGLLELERALDDGQRPLELVKLIDLAVEHVDDVLVDDLVLFGEFIHF